MSDTELSLKSFYLPDRKATWMDQAACLEEPPEFWFPVPPQNRNKSEVERYNKEVQIAQEICFECPVREKCLKDAESRDEHHGIWGGVDFYRSARHQEKVA